MGSNPNPMINQIILILKNKKKKQIRVLGFVIWWLEFYLELTSIDFFFSSNVLVYIEKHREKTQKKKNGEVQILVGGCLGVFACAVLVFEGIFLKQMWSNLKKSLNLYFNGVQIEIG